MDSETGTMVREGVEPIINPLDLYAIEEAIRLKERYGGEILAISMGPPKAEIALKEAISMGCDDGILLTHRKFAGSDTWSTSYVLAQAIRQKGDYDVVICGERATDGDTGQVGPGIAAWLDMAFATYVSKVSDVKGESLILERMVENGYELLEVEKPCLLTVVKEINYPRLPTLRGKQKAKKSALTRWGPEEIKAETKNLGLKGSPTRVVKISKPKVTRSGNIRKPKDEQELSTAVDELIAYMEKKEII